MSLSTQNFIQKNNEKKELNEEVVSIKVDDTKESDFINKQFAKCKSRSVAVDMGIEKLELSNNLDCSIKKAYSPKKDLNFFNA